MIKMMFTSLARGLFECVSDSGEKYMVDMENSSCTCKSWYFKHRPCKHLLFLGKKQDGK